MPRTVLVAGASSGFGVTAVGDRVPSEVYRRIDLPEHLPES